MNNNLKLLLGVLSGIGIGAVSTYFGVKSHFQKMYEDDVDEIREWYNNKLLELTGDIVPEEVVEISKEQVEDSKNKFSGKKAYVDYTKYAKDRPSLVDAVRKAGLEPIPDESFLTPVEDLHPEEESDEIEDESMEDTQPVDIVSDGKSIYIITKDEFFDTNIDYEKLTLTFFKVDSVLTDERMEVIESPEKFIGNESNLRFGFKSGDNMAVYIRNERNTTDYEVVLDLGSYFDAAYDETPEPPTPAKLKKTKKAGKAVKGDGV